MKKKKYIILILILIILAITIFFIIKLLINNKSKTNIQNSNVTLEDRIFWNEFLNENPYLSQIDIIIPNHVFMSANDIIKTALTSDNVETERITAEEIEKNILLTGGDGYKKSKEAITEYLNNLMGVTEPEYEMLDTFVENGKYIIENDDYVYFTKIELPEKIYIAMNYKVQNENYEVEIYEYDLTEDNSETLNSMLETGNIDLNIEYANKYTIKGDIVGDSVKITYKYSSEEDLKTY